MKTINWYKVAFFTAIAIICFVTGCNCGKNGGFAGIGKGGTTTTRSVDTVYMPATTDTLYVPEIVGVTNTIHVPRYLRDTFYHFVDRLVDVDTAAILSDYFGSYFYADSLYIGSGSVFIYDTLTQNKIVSRRVEASIPDTATIRITDTIRERKKAMGYFSLSLAGAPGQVFFGAGAGFALKAKNDWIYEVHVLGTKYLTPVYQLKIAVPINYRRNK